MYACGVHSQVPMQPCILSYCFGAMCTNPPTPPSPSQICQCANLFPTDVYQAVSAYNAKRDRIVSGELKKLQDATQSMNRCGEWREVSCVWAECLFIYACMCAYKHTTHTGACAHTHLSTHIHNITIHYSNAFYLAFLRTSHFLLPCLLPLLPSPPPHTPPPLLFTPFPLSLTVPLLSGTCLPALRRLEMTLSLSPSWRRARL